MKMDIPFNDTSRLYQEYKEALARVFDEAGMSGRWVFGENTAKFAAEFARFCGISHCLPVANGTDALELALRTVLNGAEGASDNEIVTAANAGGYTTAACLLTDAVPVYADVAPDSLLIDIESLKRCLGPKVKAVIITHLYGGVVDVAAVRKALDAGGCGHAVIIEDCSQAHGAKAGDKRAGSLGGIAVFSFYPTKNLGALGDAGAVLTSDEGLFQRLKALSQYGWNKKYRTQIAHGRNSRIDEIQAGALRLFLPRLDEWNRTRKNIYAAYKAHASKTLTPLEHGAGDYAAHLAVFRTPERERFLHFMRERGIGAEVHYPVLDCDQAAWQGMPMRIDPARGLAHSVQAAAEVVSVPCFPQMTEKEIAYICQALADWDKS